MKHGAILFEHLHVSEPPKATVLPADYRNSEELYLDSTDVIALFHERSYKVYQVYVRHNHMQYLTTSGQRY